MEVVDLPGDLAAAAVALWQEAGLTRPWNDPAADLRRALDGPSSTVLAIVEGRDLVGTAMVGQDGHRGWVYYLAVSAGRRRQGLGSVLLRAAEEWLRARGIPKVQLMVRTGNESVVAFYTALGYADAQVTVLGRILE